MAVHVDINVIVHAIINAPAGMLHNLHLGCWMMLDIVGFTQQSLSQVGYFTTNPWFKRYVRSCASIAHATRKLATLTALGSGTNAIRLNELWKALAEV